MITLQIIDDSPEARKFLEFARTLPFIREKGDKAKTAERTAPCRYTTEEEFRKAVFRGMDDIVPDVLFLKRNWKKKPVRGSNTGSMESRCSQYLRLPPQSRSFTRKHQQAE